MMVLHLLQMALGMMAAAHGQQTGEKPSTLGIGVNSLK
jgi:hypothetical protein